MEYSQVEQAILQRFVEKSRLAGGPRPGYMLRRRAIRDVNRYAADLDLGAGLEGLVEKGILQPNDGGDLFYLTERGVETLQQL